MNRLKNPRLLLILSMAVFGSIAVFVRYIPLPSSEIALYRAAMALVLIGAFLLLRREPMGLSRPRRELPLLIASGVFMAFNWVLLFEAYKYTTVSNATLSYYFAPVIVTAASALFFRERLSFMQIFCFIMAIVGVVLITGVGGGGRSDLVGILLGLSAALLYASVVLINKLLTSVPGIKRTFYQFLFATVGLLPYVMLDSGFNLSSLDAPGAASLITLGVIHTGICYCMYFSSISALPGQKVAILSYIDPLVAILLSLVLLGEEMTAPQIVGAILILGFSLANELYPTFKVKRNNVKKEN